MGGRSRRIYPPGSGGGLGLRLPSGPTEPEAMSLLLRAAAAALVLAAAPAADAQSCTPPAEAVFPFQLPRDCVEVPPEGAAATFDVASWNVVFFGSDEPGTINDRIQLDRVEAVVGQSEVDVWALQEVVDEDDFNALLDSLAGEGYAGALAPAAFTDSQRLAFVYNTAVVKVNQIRVILESQSFNFASRPPYELDATVTVDGASQDVRIINIHAKAFDDQTSYDRRAAAAAALKQYTDALLVAGESVIIAGDFNDELSESIRAGEPSPYADFVADDDYVAATLATEQAGLVTFCGSDVRDSDEADIAACNGRAVNASTVDHILISDAALSFVPEVDASQRYDALLSAVADYTTTTSDHLPVFANVRLGGAVDAADGPAAEPVALLAPAPSPFRAETALRFRLDSPVDVQLDVFDALGRRVAAFGGSYGPGEHAVPLDGADLAPGLYLVRLQAGDDVRARTVARLR